MDVAEWLRGVGLEQYMPAFRENDIDGQGLRRLTADDLRELGVVSIGHRRRLLDAIAALGDGQRPMETSPAPAPSPAVSAEAERRQLTVVFCDLVGSTELSARIDPEDLRDVIGAYHRTVAGVVAEFDGFVSRYMGDGVLVYFGYPQAHEDDAERAVRAGLGAIEAVSRLDIQSVKLRTRVGIATGLVVVGDLIAHGPAQEQSVASRQRPGGARNGSCLCPCARAVGTARIPFGVPSDSLWAVSLSRASRRIAFGSASGRRFAAPEPSTERRGRPRFGSPVLRGEPDVCRQVCFVANASGKGACAT